MGSSAFNVIEGGQKKNRSSKRSRPGEGKIRSVFSAARTGSKLLVLETMRDRVARDIQSPDTPPRDIASLSKRLMEIMDEIEVLRAKEAEVTKLQEAERVEADEEAWDGV